MRSQCNYFFVYTSQQPTLAGKSSGKAMETFSSSLNARFIRSFWWNFPPKHPTERKCNITHKCIDEMQFDTFSVLPIRCGRKMHLEWNEFHIHSICYRCCLANWRDKFAAPKSLFKTHKSRFIEFRAGISCFLVCVCVCASRITRRVSAEWIWYWCVDLYLYRRAF